MSESLQMPRVIFVGGTDGAAQRSAIAKIISDVGMTPDDMEIEQIVANDKSFQDWIGAACVLPFLSPKRIVIVRNLGRVEPAKLYPDVKVGKAHPIAKAFLALPETSLLILVHDEEANVEDNGRDGGTRESSWSKLVKHGGGSLQVFSIPKENLQKHLQDHALSFGKKLSPAAASFLLEVSGNDFLSAKTDIETLCLYIGSSDEIRKSDISAVVSPSLEYNVFRLVDSITDGKTIAALNQIRTFMNGQKKLEEAVIGQVLPMILRQFRLIWQAKTCSEAGVFPHKASADIQSTFLESVNLGKQKDWVQKKYVQMSRRISRDQLSDCYENLLRLDGSLKGVHHQVNTKESTETAIVKMCLICSRKS